MRTIINGRGPTTLTGGSRMDPEVLAAMAEAARYFVDIDALNRAVGQRIAAVTGADAKDKKGKARAKKGKTRGEFTCTAANANVPAQGGCQAGECCQSTPAGNNATCVGIFAQLNTQTCGNNAGQGVCRTCPTGTKGGLRGGVLVCICDSSTCANGCCIPGAAAGAGASCARTTPASTHAKSSASQGRVRKRIRGNAMDM